MGRLSAGCSPRVLRKSPRCSATMHGGRSQWSERRRRAGDEFYHHPARHRRTLASGKMGYNRMPAYIGRRGRQNFRTSRVFSPDVRRCRSGLARAEGRIERLLPELAEPDRLRLEDHLLLAGRAASSGCEGFDALGKSYSAYFEGSYPLAFVYASKAMWNYQKGQIALQEAEHGKWANFFRADWLTNIESTVPKTWTRFGPRLV